MPGAVGQDEGTLRGGEVAVGDVDRDALFALGPQTVGQQGEVGAGGGPAGDLYVEVSMEPHPVFRRDGDDLHMTLTVPMVDAALGTDIQVEALSGEQLTVHVAPGSQPSDQIHLPGAGMPKLRADGTGDVIAHVEVTVPKDLDSESRKLLEQLRTHREETSEVRLAAAEQENLFSRLRNRFRR